MDTEEQAGVRRLHRAVARGDLDAVKSLLSEGIDPNASRIFSMAAFRTPEMRALGIDVPGALHTSSAIHTAARHGYREIVHVLIAHGAVPDLFVAAGLDDVAMAEELVAGGASLDTGYGPCSDGCPLHWAARNSSIRVAAYLIDHGADVDSRNTYEETPLMAAAYYRHVEVTRLLLQRGADVHARRRDGLTALHVALWPNALASDSPALKADVARVLISTGAVVDLHVASGMGDIAAAESLLRSGVDVDVRTYDQETSLHWAAWNAQPEMVRFLIGNGADVNAVNTELETPLHALSGAGAGIDPADIVRVAENLLAHGADINAEDRGCDTPLGFATHTLVVHDELVRFLAEHGGREPYPRAHGEA